MEQFKFTLGTWQFLFGHTPESVEELDVPSHVSHNGKSWKFKDIKIGDENNRVIATIGARTTSDGVSNEEFEANARLIVASPDLLQACVDVLKCLENATHRSYERDLLRKAIAKAIHTERLQD